MNFFLKMFSMAIWTTMCVWLVISGCNNQPLSVDDDDDFIPAVALNGDGVGAVPASHEEDPRITRDSAAFEDGTSDDEANLAQEEGIETAGSRSMSSSLYSDNKDSWLAGRGEKKESPRLTVGVMKVLKYEPLQGRSVQDSEAHMSMNTDARWKSRATEERASENVYGDVQVSPNQQEEAATGVKDCDQKNELNLLKNGATRNVENNIGEASKEVDEDETRAKRADEDNANEVEYEELNSGRGDRDVKSYDEVEYEDAVDNDRKGFEDIQLLEKREANKQGTHKHSLKRKTKAKRMNINKTKTDEGASKELTVKNAPVEQIQSNKRAVEGDYCDDDEGEEQKIWDNWGKWTNCSTTCGAGVMTRWRHCVDGGCAKGEKEAQIQKCTNPAC